MPLNATVTIDTCMVPWLRQGLQAATHDMWSVQEGEEGEGAEGGDPASFQAYTSSQTDNFGDLGIPGRVTDEAAGLEGGMGSMTGWRAIAAQVLLLCLSRPGAGAVPVSCLCLVHSRHMSSMPAAGHAGQAGGQAANRI